MKPNEIIKKLINIPREFELGNESIFSLLEKTGYFEQHDQITEEGIRNELACNPKFVDDWLIYSESKRSSSGWFIRKERSGSYIVSNLLPTGGTSGQNSFLDRVEACAAFIKKEIDAIRNC